MIVSPIFIAVAGLLALQAFFAGAEIALLSADRLELKKKGRKGSQGAELALKLAEKPDRVLSITLFMTSLCVITVSGLMTIYIERNTEYGGLGTILMTSPLVILFGELLPKTIFQRYANRLAPRIVFPIYFTYWLLFPITRLLNIYTSHLSALIGPVFEIISGKRRTSRDEIRSVLSYDRKETGIASDEKRMIKRIFDFKDTEAQHALIPLVKVEAIEENSTIRQALERFQSHRHSRMPVYSGRIDNIVGVLSFADLLTVPSMDGPLKPFLRPALYAPETQVLEDLLGEMHRERHEMAIVVDEYGGAVGILSLEDIVEEVVGEIHDEYDSNRAAFRVIDVNTWWAQARMEIEQVNDQLKLDLPEGDYETLGGFLLQQFGRIPSPRDELYFDTSAGIIKFTIKQANDRQIETVLIERIQPKPKT